REAGISADGLLEQSMVADLTDDLLPAAALAAYNIPQVTSWDRTPAQAGDYEVAYKHRINRDIGLAGDVVVPAGAYAYWYINGNGKGLSLSAENIHLQ